MLIKRYWSRIPGNYLDSKTGSLVGRVREASEENPSQKYRQQKEWYQSLANLIFYSSSEDLNAYSSTVFVSPQMASILMCSEDFFLPIESVEPARLGWVETTAEIVGVLMRGDRKFTIFVDNKMKSDIVLLRNTHCSCIEVEINVSN